MSSSNLRLAQPRRGGKDRRWTRGHKARAPSWASSCGRPFCGLGSSGRARCGGRMKAGGAGRRGERSRVPRQHGGSGGGGNAISRGGSLGRRRQRRAGRAKSARGATAPSGDVWCLICMQSCMQFLHPMRPRALLPIQLRHAGPAPLEREAHCSTNLSHSDQQDGSQITTKE